MKPERQHLYHIYWSLLGQFRLKKSLWVIYEILGLLINPLTADDKFSLLNRGNPLQHVQMQLSEKRKTIRFFFVHFLNLYSFLDIFRKKMILWADVFLNLWTLKNGLDKCLKSLVSEDPSTSNMGNGTKHCLNLKPSAFIIFTDPSEGNSGPKSFPEWYAKS